MPITQSLHPSSSFPAEHNVVHSTQLTLKILFTAVPIVAGLDKFTHLLANWETYLNPLVLQIVPISAATFMGIVGVIEIVAGVLVWLKPRLGGLVVAAWLIAIALQLIPEGRYLDIAVRDIVIALGGALTLARLTPFAGNESARSSQS